MFDLDGTLLDSAPDLVASLNFLRSSLGLATLPVDELRHFASQGAAGLIKAGMPPCDEATLQQWLAIFLGHYAENSFVQSRPFAGVELLLSELTHRKIPWGIVTNKPEYLSIPILRKAGWLACAAAAIYGDSLKHRKPHPEPVLAACKMLGLEPARVLMVGDDPRDIEAGQRAGSPTALVLYGYGAEQCKDLAAADTAQIKSPPDILDLLGR